MQDVILIIEDNPENFYLMRFLLEKNGFLVIGAINGLDGISLAKQVLPTAILLDIQLPEMDGYAVAEELIKLKELQNVPIIAVTSYAMVGDKERALASGATAYIEKPIDPDTFVTEIIHHISLKIT
jgi:CheY-like chemotaxis protein